MSLGEGTRGNETGLKLPLSTIQFLCKGAGVHDCRIAALTQRISGLCSDIKSRRAVHGKAIELYLRMGSRGQSEMNEIYCKVVFHHALIDLCI